MGLKVSKAKPTEKLISSGLIVDRKLFLGSLNSLKLYYTMLLNSYEQSHIDLQDEPEMIRELRDQLNLVGSIVNGLDKSLDPTIKHTSSPLN